MDDKKASLAQNLLASINNPALKFIVGNCVISSIFGGLPFWLNLVCFSGALAICGTQGIKAFKSKLQDAPTSLPSQPSIKNSFSIRNPMLALAWNSLFMFATGALALYGGSILLGSAFLSFGIGNFRDGLNLNDSINAWVNSKTGLKKLGAKALNIVTHPPFVYSVGLICIGAMSGGAALYALPVLGVAVGMSICAKKARNKNIIPRGLVAASALFFAGLAAAKDQPRNTIGNILFGTAYVQLTTYAIADGRRKRAAERIEPHTGKGTSIAPTHISTPLPSTTKRGITTERGART